MCKKFCSRSKSRFARTIAVAPAVAVIALLNIFSVSAFAAEWGQTNKIVVTASDNVAVTGYFKARTDSSSSPPPATPEANAAGWQTSNEILVTQNGYYYVWAKDAAGNVSLEKTVSISKVDTLTPTIANVSLTPVIGTGVIVEVTATDADSGLASYSFDNGTTWQPENTFTAASDVVFPANSIQVKDTAGNITKYPHVVSVNGADVTAPVVSAVTSSPEWGETNTIAVTATDDVGVTGYFLTKSPDSSPVPPASDIDGWQTSNEFVVNENGSYHAWAKDAFGNVSATNPDSKIVVSKIVSVPLGINAVEVSPAQPDAETVTVKIVPTNTEGELQFSFDNGATWQTSPEKTLSANQTFPAGSIQAKDESGKIVKYPTELVVSNITSLANTSGVVLSPPHKGRISLAPQFFSIVFNDNVTGTPSVISDNGGTIDNLVFTAPRIVSFTFTPKQGRYNESYNFAVTGMFNSLGKEYRFNWNVVTNTQTINVIDQNSYKPSLIESPTKPSVVVPPVQVVPDPPKEISPVEVVPEPVAESEPEPVYIPTPSPAPAPVSSSSSSSTGSPVAIPNSSKPALETPVSSESSESSSSSILDFIPVIELETEPEPEPVPVSSSESSAPEPTPSLDDLLQQEDLPAFEDVEVEPEEEQGFLSAIKNVLTKTFRLEKTPTNVSTVSMLGKIMFVVLLLLLLLLLILLVLYLIRKFSKKNQRQ